MATPIAPPAEEVTTSDDLRIGTHALQLEGDLVCLRLQGKVNAAECQAILDRCSRVREEYGQLYILFDNTAAGNIEQAARQQFVMWVRTHPIAGVANFGGGIVQRTLALLLLNAIRIMDKKAPLQTYVASEAEARGWLAEIRRQPL